MTTLSSSKSKVYMNGWRVLGVAPTFESGGGEVFVDDTCINDQGISQVMTLDGRAYSLDLVFRDGKDQQASTKIFTQFRDEDQINDLRFLHGLDGVKVGKLALGTAAVSSGAALSLGQGDVIRFSGGATSSGDIYMGLVESPHTAVNNDFMESTSASDFTTWNITNTGGTLYSPMGSFSKMGNGGIAMAHVSKMTGTDATRPTLTINFPSGTDWRRGGVPAADDGKFVRVSHKTQSFAYPLHSGQTLVASLKSWLEGLVWPDGFRLTVVQNGSGANITGLTVTGNHYGAGEDITFPNANPTAWRGTNTGTGGGATLQLCTATGSGRTAAYVPLGEPQAADAHDLPLRFHHPVPDGFTKLALKAVVPTAGSNYSFSWDYSFGGVPKTIY